MSTSKALFFSFFWLLENFIVWVIHFSFAKIIEEMNLLRVWVVLSYDSLPWMFNAMRGCQCGVRCLGGGMFWGIRRISGLWWSVSVEWCREYELCSVSVTNGYCMSLCIVIFLTYHGASNANLSILFWSTCILSICVCDAEFHIEHAYCQIGLIYDV
jgi:hypothetical protein